MIDSSLIVKIFSMEIFTINYRKKKDVLSGKSGASLKHAFIKEEMLMFII